MKIFTEGTNLKTTYITQGQKDDVGSNCVVREGNKYLILGCKNTVLPLKILQIATYAFAYVNYDNGHTDLIIPDEAVSLNTIDEYAFYHCYGLTYIKIGNHMNAVGNYAFANCVDLIKIDLGTNIGSVGNYVWSGCSHMESIAFRNQWPCSIGDYVFHSNLVSIWTLNSDIAAQYKGAQNWPQYASKIKYPIPDGY